MSNVIIISDGTAQGTKVQIGDKFMSGVTRIEIDPVSPGGCVRARIVVDVAALKMQIVNADIVCTDVITSEKIREALLSYKESNSCPM